METPLWVVIATWAVGIAVAGVVGLALIRVISDRGLGPSPRVAWAIGIVVAPLVGALAWFAWEGALRHRVVDVQPGWTLPRRSSG